MREKEDRWERKIGDWRERRERKMMVVRERLCGENRESCGCEDVGSYINDEYQRNARGERDRQADRQTNKETERQREKHNEKQTDRDRGGGGRRGVGERGNIETERMYLKGMLGV